MIIYERIYRVLFVFISHVSIAFYIQVGKCYTIPMRDENKPGNSDNYVASKSIKNIIGMICVIASAVITICLICRYAVSDDIWYDEVFSMGFIRQNISNLIKYTSMDVHPPAYYIYLKMITGAAVSLFGTGALIPAAKFASIIPWFILLIISLVYIRKAYGMFTAGLFVLFITVMPQMGTYYTEIRMYSLALLMITAEILTAIKIADDSEGTKIHTWAVFCLMGILTAYTQYYACIAIAAVYLELLILLMMRGIKNNNKAIKALIICMIISVVAYIPWLPKLFGQMNHISGDYWIQPLTLRSIPGCVKFIILPVADYGKLTYVSAGLMALTILVSLILFLKNHTKSDIISVIFCVLPLVLVIIAGFILSIAGTPIFVYRYMIPTLGGMWLAVALILDKVTVNKAVYILLIPFIFVAVLSMLGYKAEESKKCIQMKHATEALAKIPEGSSVITNFDHVTAVYSYYRPNDNVYLYEGETDRLIPILNGNVDSSLDDEGILKLTESQSPVFFLGSFNSREEIVDSWKAIGIDSELDDSILIERYWINIYKLTKKD